MKTDPFSHVKKIFHPRSKKMRLIGVTGPSSFTTEVIRMVEEFFDSNVILLYMDKDNHLRYWMDRVSAVILSGGNDLHPMTYDRSYPAKRNMKTFDLKRDRRECKIIDMALKRKVSMLGICRGHQLLGVVRKQLDMVTDLCEDSTIIHCPSLQEPKFQADPYSPIHKIRVLEHRTLFGRKDGFSDTMWVNSFHHQGLLYCTNAQKDNDVIAVAHMSKDKNIVELMECPSERWMSCQFHPEYDFSQQESSRQFLEHFKRNYLPPLTNS